MPAKAFGKRAAALDRIREIRDHIAKNHVGLLLAKHRQPAQERQTRVDQGRQLAGENHESLALDGLSLKERNRNAAALFLRGRRGLGLCGFSSLALAFLRDALGEVAGMPELAHGGVLGVGFDDAVAFLSARVKRDVVESRHREEKFELPSEITEENYGRPEGLSRKEMARFSFGGVRVVEPLESDRGRRSVTGRTTIRSPSGKSLLRMPSRRRSGSPPGRSLRPIEPREEHIASDERGLRRKQDAQAAGTMAGHVKKTGRQPENLVFSPPHPQSRRP